MFPMYDEDEELDLTEDPPISRDPAGALSLGDDPPVEQPKEMDPMVKDHLMKKYNLGDYSDENRKKLVAQNEAGGGFGESLGAGILQATGGDGIGALREKRNSRHQALDDFDKGRANKIQENTLNRDEEKFQRESDPNSVESKMAQDLAKSMGYNGDVSGLTAAKFKDFSPIMEKKYAIEQKRMSDDAMRDERRFLNGIRSEEVADRRADRKLKNSELNATQAKQMGLYQSGNLAEEQYNKAIADPKEYDPTGVGQFIDNSEWAPAWMKNDKANEAQKAQSAWVESFLRDASGAAIPNNERMSYAKDFFGQPGESKEIVANKAALRKQKMDNALVGAGEQGKAVLAKRPPGGDKIAAPKAPADGMVRMRDPNGIVRMIPKDQVAAAEKAGGKRVDKMVGASGGY